MPVFAAEMPIRIVSALLLPSAVLRVKPALNARSVTAAPAIANRFLIVSPFVAAGLAAVRLRRAMLRKM
jgi:hypothetical protein